MAVFSHVFVEELTNNLNPVLVSFYNDNRDMNKFFSRSLHEIVNFLVQTELSSVTEKENLRSYYYKKVRLRTSKKKRYVKKCADMVDTKEYKNKSDKYFMRATLIQYSLTAEDKRDLLFDGATFEEMELAKLEEIRKWGERESSFMIEYPGEDKLTPAMIVNNFKSDIIIDICENIKNQYDFDLHRATYAVLEDLKNQPIFSAKGGSVSVNKTNEDGSPRELVIYKSEQHEKKLVITLPDKAVNENGSFKILDQIDSQILSYLLSCWDDKPENATVHSVKVIDLLHYIKPERKRFALSDYTMIVNRIARIYEVGVKGINKTMINEGMHIISGFRYDAATRNINYAFDPFYMDKFNNLRIRKMSSKPLTILTNNASKILYSSFMEQRHNAYKNFKAKGETPDEYIIPLAYNYLLYWCNFGEENKKRSYHEDIIDALDDFKNNGILIKDYVYLPNKKIYKITFFPLSEDEIKDFDFYYNIKETPIDETLDDSLETNLFIPTIED